EFVSGDDGRREAARDRHFPLQILLRADLHGRVLAVRDARTVRAAELWPGKLLLGAQAGCREYSHPDQHYQFFHGITLLLVQVSSAKRKAIQPSALAERAARRRTSHTSASRATDAFTL